MDNQIASANDFPPLLGADVFRYFAAKSPEALSSFVELLIAQNDVASLQAGLDAGVLDGLRIDAAVKHCANIFVTYAQKANCTDPDDSGASELQLARDWAQRRVERFGANFTEAIVHNLASRLGQQNFGDIVDVLKQPEFGLDLRSELNLTPAQAAHFGDTDPTYSLLGKIADSYNELALKLAGPTVERFPNTMALPPNESGKLWVTLNLAEQVMFFNTSDQEAITKIAAMAPAGSPARQQLGELALTLLIHQDDEFLCKENPDIAEIMEKSDRIVDDRASTVRVGVTLIGAGVDIPNPDRFWDYVRTSHARVFEYGDRSSQLPLAHAVLHLDADLCSRDVGAKALARMVLEGGVAPDLKDNVGRTLLQAGATLGHQEAVEMLLNLQAGPAYDQGSENRKTAAAMADEYGHPAIAKMIRAYEAQAAINSVLGQHQSVLQRV